MMNKILTYLTPVKTRGYAKAPVNIALCKYWGKRDAALHLPLTSSLSLALSAYSETTVEISRTDQLIINDQEHDVTQLSRYLDYFRPHYFCVVSRNDLPTAAGCATSASGIAALALALDDLFQWRLSRQHLSILARLGSGSAARSVYLGFVQWHKGVQADGMDSYAEPLDLAWPDLGCALLIVDPTPKYKSSREAMQMPMTYQDAWVQKTEDDLQRIVPYIANQDFEAFGALVESNALAMHGAMLSASPPVLYWQPQTLAYIQRIWHLREQGAALYFTIDAGPQLKLFFKDKCLIEENFPEARIIPPLFKYS